MQVVESGVPGLDTLLTGGFIQGRLYLVRGEPGVGKSVLGMHFLSAGLANDETVLYVHGEESQADIMENARALNTDLEDAHFLDIGPESEFFTEDVSYNLVEPTELDDDRFTEDVRDIITDLSPTRVVLDPITHFKYVEADEYQYRKRLLAFLRFLRTEDTTVLATKTTDFEASTANAVQIESLSDGIINLSYRANGRKVEVPKNRGKGQVDGTHGMAIRDDGIEVYPQLSVPAESASPGEFAPTLISVGRPAVDSLLGGGLESGSVTLLTGPTGVGKSTLGTEFLATVAESAGENGADTTALGYLFEETTEQLTYRGDALGYQLSARQRDGLIALDTIEPTNLSAEEFGHRIADEVAEYDPAFVFIDGIDGYKTALQGDEQLLSERLHTLTRWLKREDIAVVITDTSESLTGLQSATSIGVSYLADNIVAMLYTPATSGFDRAIGMVKKRIGNYDPSFYKLSITAENGLQLGEELTNFRTVVTGAQPFSGSG